MGFSMHVFKNKNVKQNKKNFKNVKNMARIKNVKERFFYIYGP